MANGPTDSPIYAGPDVIERLRRNLVNKPVPAFKPDEHVPQPSQPAPGPASVPRSPALLPHRGPEAVPQGSPLPQQVQYPEPGSQRGDFMSFLAEQIDPAARTLSGYSEVSQFLPDELSSIQQEGLRRVKEITRGMDERHPGWLDRHEEWSRLPIVHDKYTQVADEAFGVAADVIKKQAERATRIASPVEPEEVAASLAGLDPVTRKPEPGLAMASTDISEADPMSVSAYDELGDDFLPMPVSVATPDRERRLKVWDEAFPMYKRMPYAWYTSMLEILHGSTINTQRAKGLGGLWEETARMPDPDTLNIVKTLAILSAGNRTKGVDNLYKGLNQDEREKLLGTDPPTAKEITTPQGFHELRERATVNLNLHIRDIFAGDYLEEKFGMDANERKQFFTEVLSHMRLVPSNVFARAHNIETVVNGLPLFPVDPVTWTTLSHGEGEDRSARLAKSAQAVWARSNKDVAATRQLKSALEYTYANMVMIPPHMDILEDVIRNPSGSAGLDKWYKAREAINKRQASLKDVLTSIEVTDASLSTLPPAKRALLTQHARWLSRFRWAAIQDLNAFYKAGLDKQKESKSLFGFVRNIFYSGVGMTRDFSMLLFQGADLAYEAGSQVFIPGFYIIEEVGERTGFTELEDLGEWGKEHTLAQRKSFLGKARKAPDLAEYMVNHMVSQATDWEYFSQHLYQNPFGTFVDFLALNSLAKFATRKTRDAVRLGIREHGRRRPTVLPPKDTVTGKAKADFGDEGAAFKAKPVVDIAMTEEGVFAEVIAHGPMVRYNKGVQKSSVAKSVEAGVPLKDVTEKMRRAAHATSEERVAAITVEAKLAQQKIDRLSAAEASAPGAPAVHPELAEPAPAVAAEEAAVGDLFFEAKPPAPERAYEHMRDKAAETGPTDMFLRPDSALEQVFARIKGITGDTATLAKKYPGIMYKAASSGSAIGRFMGWFKPLNLAGGPRIQEILTTWKAGASRVLNVAGTEIARNDLFINSATIQPLIAKALYHVDDLMSDHIVNREFAVFNKSGSKIKANREKLVLGITAAITKKPVFRANLIRDLQRGKLSRDTLKDVKISVYDETTKKIVPEVTLVDLGFFDRKGNITIPGEGLAESLKKSTIEIEQALIQYGVELQKISRRGEKKIVVDKDMTQIKIESSHNGDIFFIDQEQYLKNIPFAVEPMVDIIQQIGATNASTINPDSIWVIDTEGVRRNMHDLNLVIKTKEGNFIPSRELIMMAKGKLDRTRLLKGEGSYENKPMTQLDGYFAQQEFLFELIDEGSGPEILIDRKFPQELRTTTYKNIPKQKESGKVELTTLAKRDTLQSKLSGSGFQDPAAEIGNVTKLAPAAVYKTREAAELLKRMLVTVHKQRAEKLIRQAVEKRKDLSAGEKRSLTKKLSDDIAKAKSPESAQGELFKGVEAKTMEEVARIREKYPLIDADKAVVVERILSKPSTVDGHIVVPAQRTVWYSLSIPGRPVDPKMVGKGRPGVQNKVTPQQAREAFADASHALRKEKFAEDWVEQELELGMGKRKDPVSDFKILLDEIKESSFEAYDLRELRELSLVFGSDSQPIQGMRAAMATMQKNLKHWHETEFAPKATNPDLIQVSDLSEISVANMKNQRAIMEKAIQRNPLMAVRMAFDQLSPEAKNQFIWWGKHGVTPKSLNTSPHLIAELEDVGLIEPIVKGQVITPTPLGALAHSFELQRRFQWHEGLITEALLMQQMMGLNQTQVIRPFYPATVKDKALRAALRDYVSNYIVEKRVRLAILAKELVETGSRSFDFKKLTAKNIKLKDKDVIEAIKKEFAGRLEKEAKLTPEEILRDLSKNRPVELERIKQQARLEYFQREGLTPDDFNNPELFKATSYADASMLTYVPELYYNLMDKYNKQSQKGAMEWGEVSSEMKTAKFGTEVPLEVQEVATGNPLIRLRPEVIFAHGENEMGTILRRHEVIIAGIKTGVFRPAARKHKQVYLGNFNFPQQIGQMVKGAESGGQVPSYVPLGLYLEDTAGTRQLLQSRGLESTAMMDLMVPTHTAFQLGLIDSVKKWAKREIVNPTLWSPKWQRGEGETFGQYINHTTNAMLNASMDTIQFAVTKSQEVLHGPLSFLYSTWITNKVVRGALVQPVQNTIANLTLIGIRDALMLLRPSFHKDMWGFYEMFPYGGGAPKKALNELESHVYEWLDIEQMHNLLLGHGTAHRGAIPMTPQVSGHMARAMAVREKIQPVIDYVEKAKAKLSKDGSISQSQKRIIEKELNDLAAEVKSIEILHGVVDMITGEDGLLTAVIKQNPQVMTAVAPSGQPVKTWIKHIFGLGRPGKGGKIPRFLKSQFEYHHPYWSKRRKDAKDAKDSLPLDNKTVFRNIKKADEIVQDGMIDPALAAAFDPITNAMRHAFWVTDAAPRFALGMYAARELGLRGLELRKWVEKFIPDMTTATYGHLVGSSINPMWTWRAKAAVTAVKSSVSSPFHFLILREMQQMIREDMVMDDQERMNMMGMTNYINPDVLTRFLGGHVSAGGDFDAWLGGDNTFVAIYKMLQTARAGKPGSAEEAFFENALPEDQKTNLQAISSMLFGGTQMPLHLWLVDNIINPEHHYDNNGELDLLKAIRTAPFSASMQNIIKTFAGENVQGKHGSLSDKLLMSASKLLGVPYIPLRNHTGEEYIILDRALRRMKGEYGSSIQTYASTLRRLEKKSGGPGQPNLSDKEKDLYDRIRNRQREIIDRLETRSILRTLNLDDAKGQRMEDAIRRTHERLKKERPELPPDVQEVEELLQRQRSDQYGINPTIGEGQEYTR